MKYSYLYSILCLFMTALNIALTVETPQALARGGYHHSYASSSSSYHAYSSKQKSESSPRSPNEHYISSYTRHQDGTPVKGHYATNPDNVRNNNYSTIGNINPHTGEESTKPAYPSHP